MTNPVTVLDDTGRRMFAFSPATDPFAVLAAVAWAVPNSVPICGQPCPAVDGLYCLDCHAVGHAALSEARRREADCG